jgi:hypothetical protein
MELRLLYRASGRKDALWKKGPRLKNVFHIPLKQWCMGFVWELENWVMGLLFMGPHIRDSGGTAHDLVHVKKERVRAEESTQAIEKGQQMYLLKAKSNTT